MPRALVQPVQRFMREEAAAGAVMVVAAVVALVWANSPAWESYDQLFSTPVQFRFGDLVVLDELSLGEWVNEGLMTLFFFLMAMEIKREAVRGELADPRKAAVPLVAAVGGMVVPALLFVALNAGTDAVSGWGIPMATDIAFALAVVSLAGRRLPAAAKVFILTLAVADDVGAIVVIALVYSSDLAPSWLAVAGIGVVGLVLAQRADVRSLVVVVALSAVIWFALLRSGVEATLAGVLVGLLVPSRAFYDPARYAEAAQPLVDRLQATLEDATVDAEEAAQNVEVIEELVNVSRESVAPLDRLTHALEPWVAFAVVPLFALANAGVRVVEAPSGGFDGTIVLGVLVGLVVGKTVGVLGATWLAVRLGVGRLADGLEFRHVAALAVVAGIGFTVALFVTELAYDERRLVDSAKVGILGASAFAGAAGYGLLRLVGRRARVAGES